MAMLGLILEIICLLTVDLGYRETLLDIIRMTNKSYLIVHEETLSDTGKRLYTKSALVRNDNWEIERNGVIRTSVLFR